MTTVPGRAPTARATASNRARGKRAPTLPDHAACEHEVTGTEVGGERPRHAHRDQHAGPHFGAKSGGDLTRPPLAVARRRERNPPAAEVTGLVAHLAPGRRPPAPVAERRADEGNLLGHRGDNERVDVEVRASPHPRKFQAAIRTMSRGLLRSPRTADASKPECIAQLAQRRSLRDSQYAQSVLVQNSFQSRDVLFADEVAGRLPALGREGHRAPGRAVVVALAGRELQVHRRRAQRVLLGELQHALELLLDLLRVRKMFSFTDS